MDRNNLLKKVKERSYQVEGKLISKFSKEAKEEKDDVKML
tara:strand:- start:150 stop:269 length:120 start_codon:yes stop_codon:yes gene_type:complete